MTSDSGATVVPVSRIQSLLSPNEPIMNSNAENRGGEDRDDLEAFDTNEETVAKLPRESHDGYIEYKRLLVNPTPSRFQHLVTQLKYRLTEGGGEAVYELGVEDNGTPIGISQADLDASIATLSAMAEELGADATVLRVRSGDVGRVGEVLVRLRCDEPTFLEVRIATMGNVDAGKSTLLGVLTRGNLDNGRGLARSSIFRHAHEVESGRTSTIAHEIVGFDSKGEIVNYRGVRMPSWPEICSQSSKVVTFFDLAGHERYFKTTVFGLTGLAPDFAMLLVGANQGMVGMSKDHLGIALALKLPVFVVITKTDMAPPNVFAETMAQVMRVLKAPGCRKIPLVVKSHDDVVVAARNFDNGRVAPIFPLSSVTGDNLDVLRLFLNLLPVKREWEKLFCEPAEFHLDGDFSVPGIGTVASGSCFSGTIRAGQSDLFLGPDANGHFHPVKIKSIHSNRTPVTNISAGKSASFALHKVHRNFLRKGMVIVSQEKAVCCYEFVAEVLVLFHSTTIGVGYQAMVHVGCVRQNAKLVEIIEETDNDKSAEKTETNETKSSVIRAGDKAKVRFLFLYHPEFVKPNTRLVFREGRTKGIGRIVSITPFKPHSSSHDK